MHAPRLLVLAAIGVLFAQSPELPNAKPVPRVQAIPLPYDQISFQRDEQEIARYHFGPSLLRPFVYPVIGPSGRTLTRMGHPGDPYTHSHHNSVWISLSKVNGVDFWSDHGSHPRGGIIHQRVEHVEDGPEAALVTGYAQWVADYGAILLNERRSTVVKLRDAKQWMLVIDLELSAPAADVTLDAAQFGPIGVRMAKSIGVHHGGGRVRNSEGAEGEEAIFRKPARWVDYSGQIAPNTIEGLTLMSHPSNPRHPEHFHVREDGWMGIIATQQAPLVISAAKPLKLRYGVWVHAGLPAADVVDREWKRFATEPLMPAFGPPRNVRDCRHGDFRRFNIPKSFASAAECEEFVKRNGGR